jgi:hypothetical protein
VWAEAGEGRKSLFPMGQSKSRSFLPEHSKECLNINIRLGYHFVINDALSASNPKVNDRSLRFKVSGAFPGQILLRAQFLAAVVTEHSFESGVEGRLCTGFLKTHSIIWKETETDLRVLLACLFHSPRDSVQTMSILLGEYRDE